MTDDNLEKDDDGRTWIHHSVRKTEPLVCLKALLSAETMQLRDREGRSCLHVAAEQGSVHSCRLIFQTNEIVQHEAYIHDRDKCRQTPLHLATKNGHARVLKELLDHGADPYLQGIDLFLSFVLVRRSSLFRYPWHLGL
jgi:ankyrin repeat protein